MADFPRLEYSMRTVRRAGESLAREIPWHEERAAEIKEIFQIANSWRDSHFYPMAKIRAELVGQVRRCRQQGITVARLKRMRSIRKKLRRINENLSQIQDLGGCRTVLPSIKDVEEFVAAYKERVQHEQYDEDDYITHPKKGGYRSQHLMFRYNGSGEDEVFNNRRIEVQVRTRLQHSWATAVEAVGTFRGEDMKAGIGDADWLRLFELMSAELAVAEDCPEPPGLPAHQERIREIRDLNRQLNALENLETLRRAVQFTETYVQGDPFRPKYYLIVYDNVKRTVRVRPRYYPIESVTDYGEEESADNMSGEDRTNAVLVEADKIDSLKEAYPNYFGDVQLFSRNLLHLIEGKGAREYTMPPQEVAPPPPHEVPDLSWFRRTGRRRYRR